MNRKSPRDLNPERQELSQLTFFKHAYINTLLISAVLATIPVPFINWAIFREVATCVLFLVLHSSLEESLATFTAGHSIVVTRSFIPTNYAEVNRVLHPHRILVIYIDDRATISLWW